MKKVVLLISLILLFVCGCSASVKKESKLEDEDKISSEYSLPDEHLFTYLNISEFEKLLNSGKGIVVISSPDNDFSEYFLNAFNDVLRDLDIDKVYYFDYLNVKDLSDDLKEKLSLEEDRTIKPLFYLINKGKIVEKYNLDLFEVEDTTPFSNKDFMEKLNNYYKDIICKLYNKNDNCKK